MPVILIVEDNDMNRDMLSRRLERLGYEVLCAHDARDAIKQAKAARPDLILMDIALGPIDGLEATAHLKSDGRTAMIPIIALTAHALESDRERSLAAGCIDFDTKPIDLHRLRRKIEAALGAHAT